MKFTCTFCLLIVSVVLIYNGSYIERISIYCCVLNEIIIKEGFIIRLVQPLEELNESTVCC